MPHIHTQPNHHDMTVSAWIVRRVGGEWKCMVHYHKKMDVLMQIGGHIELDETPWQTVANELREESGYDLRELAVLQFTADRIAETGGGVSHPTPIMLNTHLVGDEHFHSDMCYGFVATAPPAGSVASGESSDIRWLSQAELDAGAANGEVLRDVAAAYRFVLKHLSDYQQIPADTYSVEKPAKPTVTYKRGRPGGE